MSIFTKIFGDPNIKVIKKLQPIVDSVNSFEASMQSVKSEDLKAKTLELKEKLKAGKTLDDLLSEAFALFREASKRAINIRHFDVQLIGAMVLHQGEIAEMKTGEGKTFVASLSAFLNALPGQGCHVITVNDYLARRDAGWNGPVNELLGLKTSCIINQQAFIFDSSFVDEGQADERLKHLKPCSRKEAYQADITYGTNSEFGFDYLRDNMVYRNSDKVQRVLKYAIVDEVDSILIDEARTPLIISAPSDESASLYQQFAQIVPRLKENEDYNIDEKMRAVTLTDEGIAHVEKILGMGNIYTQGGIQMVHHLEQALKAHTLFKLDRDYVVKDGEIIIIDEFTGRLMQGRRYSEGLHQAIEAKEGVTVQKESKTMATITIQNYFRMYEKLSGMTGTAATEAEEFAKIYKLDVTAIPTNRPVIRKDLTDKIFSTEKGKLLAVVEEIKRIHATGQPILVGTISIEKNEMLSALLKREGIAHQLLNAKQHEKEAQILSQAGQKGAVTVATNMAGRGVDIILGGTPFDQAKHDEIAGLGGLFVLGTERHEARRIDNQLRGRAGRQGDPGMSQFFLSMEDDLMRIFGSDRMKRIMQSMGLPEDMPIENGFISRSIASAQMKVEGNNFDIRKHLVEYDDVINKQRTLIYKKRDQLLSPDVDLKDEILRLIEEEIEQVVSFHTAGDDQSAWNMKEIGEVVATIFPLTKEEFDALQNLEKLAGDRQQDAGARTLIIEYLVKLAREKYEVLQSSLVELSGNEKAMRVLESQIMLGSIDNLWIEHLDAIDALRSGIGLRGYGQRDPLIEYQREAKQMFIQLLNLINKQVVYSVYKLGAAKEINSSVPKNVQENFNPSPTQFGSDPYKGAKRVEQKPIVAGAKVGRNEPCPCGSGKKYKKCCGE